jgi:hypothetical protein
MECVIVRHIDALCFSEVPDDSCVTCVTAVVRSTCTIERTIHQLREVVYGIAANIDDHIDAFRDIELVCSFRKIKDEHVRLGIETLLRLGFNFQPSAAALLCDDCVGTILSCSICAVCTGNHCRLSICKVDRYTLNNVVGVVGESVIRTVDLRSGGNFKVTTKCVQHIKVQITTDYQLGQSTLTRSCIVSCEGVVTHCGVSANGHCAVRVMTLTTTDFKIAKAENCIVKRILRINT